MSDLDRVKAWLDEGILLRPDAATPSLVNLTRAMAMLAGAAVDQDPATTHVADAIGSPEHLVFVLADGLGMNLVEERNADSILRRGLAMSLTTVFPSSTAPALTSLATGLWPSEHAVTAWHVYLPRPHRQVTALPYIERFTEKPAASIGVDAETLFPCPTLPRRYARDYRAFSPRRIADSVYSRYVSSGMAARPYDKLNDGIDAAIARVREARLPTYTQFYYPGIDTAAHDHGPDSTPTTLEVAKLEAALRRLVKGLEGTDARVVVSADHGQVLVERDEKLYVRPGDDLMELLVTPPSGEGRVSIFHCLRGAQDEFARRFRVRFGSKLALLSTDEVEALHLFGPGPLSPTTRERLGDYVSFSAGNEVLVYSPDVAVAKMRGFHGGLSPAEMLVPLVVL